MNEKSASLPADPKGLAELVKELDAAMEQHQQAELVESAARRDMCEATNRLNAAQKALDEYVAELKRKAPWNTDWKAKRGLPEALPS